MLSLAVASTCFALALPAVADAPSSTLPPKEAAPIDSATVLASLEAVIADNPSSGSPAVVIDDCPFGDPLEIAVAVDEVVPINPLVLTDGDTHAWVNPDSEQPGGGCWAAYDSLDEPGVFWVEVYARSWRGGEFDGINWSDRWLRVDQSEDVLLNGDLYLGCLVLEDPADTDRACIAQWVDPTVGLELEVTLKTNDGSVTAADADTAMRALLPALASTLAGAG